MNHKTIERPGYFGKKRDEVQANYDSLYGKNKWKLSWKLGSLILDRPEALQIYEDSYYEYFKANESVLHWLTSNYGDVFDTAPSNIHSKFDYNLQETPNNHLHDIAVRRAVLRNGVCFNGDKNNILEIRGKRNDGWILSPCNIPFHLPKLIYRGQIKDYGNKGNWWRKLGIENSVEEWYQQNKVLQVIS
ncbi:hypothetical protein J4408_00145 [Candidatus Pacearchaeota archaeon]|nr:hypothetical protein [Candidatus Pacearchaeota archaeon]